jgi:hypothetical protein
MDAGRLRFGMKILRRKMAISLGEENAAQLDTLTRGTKTGVAQFHSDPISRISDCPTAFHRGYNTSVRPHPTQNTSDGPEPSAGDFTK